MFFVPRYANNLVLIIFTVAEYSDRRKIYGIFKNCQ